MTVAVKLQVGQSHQLSSTLKQGEKLKSKFRRFAGLKPVHFSFYDFLAEMLYTPSMDPDGPYIDLSSCKTLLSV